MHKFIQLWTDSHHPFKIPFNSISVALHQLSVHTHDELIDNPGYSIVGICAAEWLAAMLLHPLTACIPVQVVEMCLQVQIPIVLLLVSVHDGTVNYTPGI